MYLAAESGLKDIADLLISNGADVNKTVNSTGWSALDIASLNGHEEVVKLLIDYGADVNLATQEGWSALDLAIKNGHTKIAEMLKTEEKKTEVSNYTKYVSLKKEKTLSEIQFHIIFNFSAQFKIIHFLMHSTLQRRMVSYFFFYSSLLL